MISWYPVIAVLKQSSAAIVPVPPKPRPKKVVPSASTMHAVGFSFPQVGFGRCRHGRIPGVAAAA